MTIARRTALLFLTCVGVLSPTAADAHGFRTVAGPPWDAAYATGMCPGYQTPVDYLLGECEVHATADARNGRTRSVISTAPRRTGMTLAAFHTNIPDVRPAHWARVVGYLRIDEWSPGARQDELLAQISLGHSACDCFAQSDNITLNDPYGSGTSGVGEVIGIDAILEVPAMETWVGAYEIGISITASTFGDTPDQELIPHTLRSTVTLTSVELYERT